MHHLVPQFLDMLYQEDVINLTSLTEVRDAFHSNQLRSKEEAACALRSSCTHTGSLLYIGSWFGVYTRAICDEYPEMEVDSVDMDLRCKFISDRFNQSVKNYRENFVCDINCFDRLNNYDTIINLSSEHMSNNWFDRIEPGKSVVIQSNNLPISDHINTCASLEEMIAKFPMADTKYATELKLNVYTRFTLAGIK
jgi:hypothetical protein